MNTNGLDWRHHRIGPPQPCRYCQRPAFLRDEENRPAHKVCAEQHQSASALGPLAEPAVEPRRAQGELL